MVPVAHGFKSARRPSVVRTIVLTIVVTIVVACVAMTAAGRPASGMSSSVRAESAPSPPADSEEPFQILDYRYGPDPYNFVNMYFPGGPGPYPVLLYLHS